ncbi:MAG: penicillin-binding protein 1A [Terriglobales bacterium]
MRKTRRKARSFRVSFSKLKAWARSSKTAQISLIAAAVVLVVGLSTFLYVWVKYGELVDERMRGQVFNNASRIYAAPRILRVGQKVQVHDVAGYLRRAGYAPDDSESEIGNYRILASGIEIQPGPASYFGRHSASITVEAGKVARILVSGSSARQAPAYELEPLMVTSFFDTEQRTKRRLVSYDDIPKVLVDAVLAIEDRRFFDHGGVNFFRFAEAAWVNLREGKPSQGGSTLTMQISRGFFLTPEKTVKRKLTEILIAFQLEQRFSKKQIFELYANQVYMGQRGSFAIRGFGEASRSYCGKDMKSLTLPEAALLAAVIQRPSFLSPYRHPQRAQERRNLVLDGMVETGAISREEAERAKAAPLKLAPPNVEASDAPYFVDLVKEQLLEQYSERDLNEEAYRIYTTLDPELQNFAAGAVYEGMKKVDEQIKKARTRRVAVGKGKFENQLRPGPQAQVALVALDPHTGAVLALVGGRDYSASQLNHAVAQRPTGSVFKPFVYAAAVNTAITGADQVLTMASLIDDSPTTFVYGDQVYEPRNYQEKYHGPVTARFALALSLNNATVRLAEQVGYDQVAKLARDSGVTSARGTPAVALGAYDATPLDIAGAYTVFANGGTRLTPRLLNAVRNAKGELLGTMGSDRKQVLDPRVAYVMTTMMEAVINSGTAAGVRGMGFSAPAAGKTGTSHDAWFAGYTSNLLCIVWVGFDDYSDLKMSGANTAAPIWTEFMKKAAAHPQYSDARGFSAPPGVTGVLLDKNTNLRATAKCPETYTAVFISGTEPLQTCEDGSRSLPGMALRLLGVDPKPLPPVLVSNSPQEPEGAARADGSASPPEKKKKKRSFFGRIFGGSDDEEEEPPKPQPPPAPPPKTGTQTGKDPAPAPH